jgi:hypothetical protein
MAIPWFQIVKLVPEIVSVSKQLLHQTQGVRRSGSGKALEERVAELEENERKQADLVAQMAQEIAGMIEAGTALQRRCAIAIGVAVVSLLVAIIAVILAIK